MKKIDFDFSNMGGIEKIYAIPPASFVGVREDATSGQCRLELTRPEDIVEIYVIEDTAVFTEEQSREAPGTAREVSITGIIPKACLPNRQQLLWPEHTPLLVLFLDYNGNIRLAGTEENRPVFTRRETTGTVMTRNQIEFEIRGKQTIPCYFIHSLTGEFFLK